MNRIAILDGYDGPDSFGDMSAYWKRSKKTGRVYKRGRLTRKQGKAFRRMKKAARTCSNLMKRGKVRNYQSCMSKRLKKHRSRR